MCFGTATTECCNLVLLDAENKVSCLKEGSLSIILLHRRILFTETFNDNIFMILITVKYCCYSNTKN